MATTYRNASNLREPAYNDTGWNTVLDANFDDLDASPMYGGLCCSLHEVPSASLAVKVSAGRYRKADGTLATYAGTASQALTLSATNYVYLLDSTGVLTVSTSGWPAAFHVPLAVAVCGATTVTTLTDSRAPCSSAGANLNAMFLPLAANDALATQVVNTGVSNGVRIGASTSDKLAFWGGTPGGPPTVTGSRAGNAALASLLSGLAARGLIIDSSSA
jgi:hypothetical protein